MRPEGARGGQSLFDEDGAALPSLPIPAQPGERVLWYGEPDTRLIPRGHRWREMLFGALGLGLALALLRALNTDAPRLWWQALGSWVFTLTLLGGSVALWVLPIVTDRDCRRGKRYWLTNRRAIIQNEPRALGRHAASDLDPLRAAGFWVTPLSPAMPLRRWHRTVRFAWAGTRYQEYRYKDGVGFDRIDAAPRVLALIQSMIREQEHPT